MKKGFIVSSLTLVLTSSLSTTSFALPLSSILIEPIVAISETLSEIPTEKPSIEHKKAVIKKYEENRLRTLFGGHNKLITDPPSTLEDHIYKIINQDMEDIYRELEPKMSEIDKNTQQAISHNNLHIYDKIDLADKKYHKKHSENVKKLTVLREDFNKAQSENTAHFSQMEKKISKTTKQANSGIASVAAMSNIPYAMNTRFSLGAGLGNYRNGNAVAVGAQYQIKENVNLRSSVSWNNSDSAVVGAGVAIGW
ncbi:YadA-like family protein [Providencia manganoxydans]|uniref:YadA-like family protein n=1 Tax=Providencia manganoxydans TaxID=2923283 RepID=UPI0034E51F99